MSTVQQMVDALGGGWTLYGSGTPIEETKPVTVPDPLGVKPPTTINQGTGRYYVIVQRKEPNGQIVQRMLPLKGKPVQRSSGPPLEVKQSGVNDTIPDTKNDPSGAKGTRIPNPNIYTGNTAYIDWDTGGGLEDVPSSNNQQQVSPFSDWIKIDANGNQIAPGDTTTKPVRLADPKDPSKTIDIPQAGNGTLSLVGNDYYVVKPDGSGVRAVDAVTGKPLSKSQDLTGANVPGIGFVSFNPSTGETKVEIPADTTVHAKDLGANLTKEINGKTYMAIDAPGGGINWVETNLPTNHIWTASYGANDPNSPSIVFVDQNLNTQVIPKPDWKPPPVAGTGQGLTADTEAPFQVTIGADGKPVYTKNENRLTISQAQQQMLDSLHMHVADGSISEKAAQELISQQTAAMVAQAQQQSAAAAYMTAQTGQQRLGADAAQNAITGVNNAAQTGANLLQNRVTAGTGALNQVVSTLGSGNLLGSLPGDWGQRMAAGIGDFTAALGGGQGVYDAAAEMVKSANPAISGNPTVAQQAYQTLRGYMDLYKAQTGQDWQPGQQTGSAQPGQASSTFTAPTTSSGPTTQGIDQQLQALQQAAAQAQAAQGVQGLGNTTALNQRGLLDTPQGRAMAAGQTPVATTPMGAPVTQVPGMINSAYQQGIVSPVGRPATGPVVGSTVTPLPMIPGVYSPYGPWTAPVT